MKRFFAFLTLALLCCTLSVSAKDKWVKIKSKHFTLVGNASEKDVRTVGTKLEQFRSVFAQLFPRVRVDSPVPITVLVFKDKNAYKPFMPVWNGKINEVGGYFLPGQEINYISLAAEFGGIRPYGFAVPVDDPYRVIFHEFVHSLTHDSNANLPPWLNEGLAEFYSMFEVSDKDTKVELGAPISQHVHHLRGNQFLVGAGALPDARQQRATPPADESIRQPDGGGRADAGSLYQSVSDRLRRAGK
jgi:hypothetical protein